MKKSLSVLLAVIFVLCPLAIASAAGNNNYVYVSGTLLNKDGAWRYDSNGKLVEAYQDNYNFWYDSDTNYLMLNNAEIVSESYSDGTGGIVAKGDLKIELRGDNKITVRKSTAAESFGILSAFGDDITIKGDGSLDIIIEAGGYNAGIFTQGDVEIDSTDIYIESVNSSTVQSFGISALKTYLDCAKVEMKFENTGESCGFYSYPEGALLNNYNGDIDITANGCKSFYGIYLYGLISEAGDIDITVNDSSPAYDSINQGIYCYNFMSRYTPIDIAINVKSDSPSHGAISFYEASINDLSYIMPMGSTAARFFSVDNDGVEISAYYLNSLVSIYNPVERVYGGYFKTENGVPKQCSENSDWNIYYDVTTNTLTLRNANLTNPLRYMGYANIVLEGDSTINGGSDYALSGAFAHKISGYGTLTLVSQKSCTAFAPEFSENTTVLASTNADGSNADDYSVSQLDSYKWIKITSDDPVEGEEENLNFFQKIIRFFKNLFDKIFSIFS